MRSAFNTWSTRLLASSMVLAASASTALAGTAGNTTGKNSFDLLNPDPDAGSTIGNFQGFAGSAFQSVINIILFVAGAVAVIYLIWAGFRYITAGGDTKKADEARKGIINAIIGIIVIIAAYFIVRVAVSAGGTVTEVDSNSEIF